MEDSDDENFIMLYKCPSSKESIAYLLYATEQDNKWHDYQMWKYEKTHGNHVTMKKLILSDNYEAAEQYLLNNPDCIPDQQHVLGRSYLMCAVMKTSLNMCRMLLSRGTDPNRPSQNMAPLQVAIMLGSIEISEVLLQHGADPNIDFTDGTTALNTSITIQNHEIMKILLYYDANPDHCDRFQSYPIHCVVKTKQVELFRLFYKLINTIDLNIQSESIMLLSSKYGLLDNIKNMHMLKTLLMFGTVLNDTKIAFNTIEDYPLYAEIEVEEFVQVQLTINKMSSQKNYGIEESFLKF